MKGVLGLPSAMVSRQRTSARQLEPSGLPWLATVPDPITVRYAWAVNPVANLYAGSGLPATPFRSDNFPAITDPKVIAKAQAVAAAAAAKVERSLKCRIIPSRSDR